MPLHLPWRRLPSGHLVIAAAPEEAEPLDFIIDTAASVSVLSRQTAQAIGLPPTAGSPARAEGALGQLQDLRLITLKRLRIGAECYPDQPAAVADLAPIVEQLGQPVGGILGADFLTQHVIDLDFPARRLTLYRDGESLAGAARSQLVVVPFTCLDPLPGLIRLPVRLAGRPLLGVLDLGAGRSIVNPAAAQLAPPVATDSGGHTACLLGADSHQLSVRSRRFALLELGAVRFASPELFVADLPLFETLGGRRPAMVVGVDLLAGRRAIISYPTSELLLSRAAQPAP